MGSINNTNPVTSSVNEIFVYSSNKSTLVLICSRPGFHVEYPVFRLVLHLILENGLSDPSTLKVAACNQGSVPYVMLDEFNEP